MKTFASFHSSTLAHAFEQSLEVPFFVRRTRESYTEDLKSLLTELGQQPVRMLISDVLHICQSVPVTGGVDDPLFAGVATMVGVEAGCTINAAAIVVSGSEAACAFATCSDKN